MYKLLFELSVPTWARQFGVSDNGLAVLQSACTFSTLEEQERYIRKYANVSECAGVLNALSYAHDKGLV